MKYCNNCNIKYADDKNFCRSCGKPLTLISERDFIIKEKIKAYEEGLNNDPNNIQLLLVYAQYLYDINWYEDAVPVLMRLLITDESNVEAKQLLLDCYIKLGLNQQAFEIGEELHQTDKNNIILLERLIQISKKIKNQEKKSFYFDQLKSIKPDNVILASYKAKILLSDNKIAEALSLFSYIGKEKIDDPLLQIYWGISNVLNSNYQKAFKIFETIDYTENDIHLTRLNLYWAYSSLRTNDEIGFIKNIIYNEDNFILLKRNYFEEDENIAAELLFYLVNNDTSDNISSFINRIHFYFTEKSHKTVAKCRFLLSEAEIRTGDLSEALKHAKTSASLDPSEIKYQDQVSKIQLQIDSEEKRKQKKSQQIFVILTAVILIIIVVVVFFRIRNRNIDNNDWAISQQTNTIESYEEYLINQPKGNYIDQAKSMIENLVWQNANDSTDINMYKEYISKYPNGKYFDQAESMIEELVWQNTNNSTDINMYKEYISKYPNGKYFYPAKYMIEEHSQSKFLITNGSVGFFEIGGSWQNSAKNDYNYKSIQDYGSCIDACCDGGFDLGRNLIVNKYGRAINPEITIGAILFEESSSFDDESERNKYKNNKDVFYISSDNCSGWYWNDKINYVIVYSDLFKTKEEIGVGTTLEEAEDKFGKLGFYVGWIEEDGNALKVVIKSYPNISFILNINDYKGDWDDINLTEDKNSLKVSDFKQNTKIKRLIIN